MSSGITGSVIAALAGMIGSLMSYLTKKLALKNASDMKAAALAETEQRLKDAAVRTVSKGDIGEIRKGVVE